MNRAGLNMIQADSLEQVQGTSVYTLVAGEYHEVFQALLRDVFHGESRTLEFMMIGLKGGHCWSYTQAVPLRNDRGEIISALLVTVDITERKRAEDAVRSALAEKEVLLKEVHHRVKNNMQVISSLLNLQAKKIQSPDLKIIFEETRSRIKSMSFIHEMLYNNKDFSKINCSDYFNKLVKDLVSAANVTAKEIKTTVKIDDIMLGVDTAIPLGLITNELVTNALKYAFPHDGGGELIVSLTKVAGTFTLSVKDNGTGLPEGFDYKNVNTLGLQLVSVMVKQMRGTFTIRSERGTEAIMTFN